MLPPGIGLVVGKRTMDEGTVALAAVPCGALALALLLLWSAKWDKPPDPRDPFGSNDE